jgi:NhaA family Na+:H+ antiporter
MAQTTDKADLLGGIILAIATLAALLAANSPLAPHYSALLQATGEVRFGSIGLAKSLEHWINDGLMAIFFLFVALEIKREFIEGSLADVRKAALPAVAAIGGFALPAMFYVAVNWGDAEALRGWAVPVATDIAFAVGICAVLGRIVPVSLKTFLLVLAIIDDLMGIIVIALFYTYQLSGLGGPRNCRARRSQPSRCAPAFILHLGRDFHMGLRPEIRGARNFGWRCGWVCHTA